MNPSPPVEGVYDSHAHLADDAFEGSRDLIIFRARQNGVLGIILPGDTLETSRKSLELARSWPDFLKAAVGLHPYDAKHYCDAVEIELRTLAADPLAVAIGEIGLDHRPAGDDPSPRDVQREAFLRQLSLSESLNLPAIIHCRNAYDEMISLLAERPARERPGVIHCFSGTAAQAEALAEMRYYIGFTGVITFRNAEETRRAARSVPRDRLLIETDCPYLSPHPVRGKFPNEPANVRYVADGLASCLGLPIEDLCRITSQNTIRLFG